MVTAASVEGSKTLDVRFDSHLNQCLRRSLGLISLPMCTKLPENEMFIVDLCLICLLILISVFLSVK